MGGVSQIARVYDLRQGGEYRTCVRYDALHPKCEA